jgi:pimeloyl-ACP methyl ester carboxylesterase
MDSSIKFDFIPTNGIRLHTALAGPEDGEPVILLHGFPEAWFGWGPQIDALAAAGFRVIAPDQRGYNLSDKPKGVTSYCMHTLAADIVGLADSLGFERFCLGGHDFGAMVGWHVGMKYPERLKRLAIANVPHPAVMRSYIRKHPSQMSKSWYALFFQVPVLPERIVRAGNWRMLMSAMPAGLSEEERDHYREAWAQRDAMTGMINWYRSMLRHPPKLTGSPRIPVPTLVVWGKQDPHLSYGMAPLSVDLCENGRLVTFEDATHWVQHDKPEEVSSLLIEHFRGE